jgi:hypothetical protein
MASLPLSTAASAVALATCLVVLSLVPFAWIGLENLHLQDATRQLPFVMPRIGIDRALKAPLPEVRLLDAPRELRKLMLTQVRPDMPPADVDYQMRSVAQRFPTPRIVLRHALAASLNG